MSDEDTKILSFLQDNPNEKQRLLSLIKLSEEKKRRERKEEERKKLPEYLQVLLLFDQLLSEDKYFYIDDKYVFPISVEKSFEGLERKKLDFKHLSLEIEYYRVVSFDDGGEIRDDVDFEEIVYEDGTKGELCAYNKTHILQSLDLPTESEESYVIIEGDYEYRKFSGKHKEILPYLEMKDLHGFLQGFSLGSDKETVYDGRTMREHLQRIQDDLSD